MNKAFSFAIIMACGVCLTACNEVQSDASGVFEARSVTVSSEVSGRILALDVKEGDKVTKDQELALVDTLQYYLQRKQLLAARSSMNKAGVNTSVQTGAIQSQIEQLEREKQRVDNLIAVGAATKRQKEQIETQIAALRNQIKAADEQIDNTNNVTDGQKNVNSVQVEALNTMLERCHVKSPIAGTVLSTFAEVGEVTGAGHPLLKISDLDDVWLMAYFPGSKMSSISVGQKVKITTLYGGENEREYEGTITWIASESQFTPKSVPTADERANIVYAVKIAIKNDGKIRTGLSGEVWLK